MPKDYYKIRIISPSKDRRDSIVEMIFIFLPSLLLIVFGFLSQKITAVQSLSLFLLIPSVPFYLILHEFLHGMVYLILTGQRFKIGRNKDGFYCILPQLFVYRKTQLLCASAPFIVFTITLLGGSIVAIINQSSLFMISSCLLAFHLFACRSDIYLMKELLKIKNARNLLICEAENGDNIVFRRK